MNTQVESSTQTQPAEAEQGAAADPIEVARQLVRLLSESKTIKAVRMDPNDETEDFADERTLVLAGVGIAIAHHLRRVADAIEQRNQPLPF